MRIGDLVTTETDAGVRVSAVLRWEDSERPDDVLYFTSPRIVADLLLERPEAFVLAAFPLALWTGERRVHVEGALCPRLREGLLLATEQWSVWHPTLRPVAVEATRGFSPAALPPRRHEAMLLSGGVDSMALLRRNRIEFGDDHPCSIKTGFFVFGMNTFDFADGSAVPDRRSAMAEYGDRLAGFARAQGIEFVSVETNARALYPNFEVWSAVGWALTTVAAGLSASSGVSDLWLASNGVGLGVGHRSQIHLAPWVSPVGLDIRVGERVATRLDETRLVADWEGAGEVVRSCFWLDIPDESRLNCGVCEKCVRTMLALVALGRETAIPSFPVETLTASLVEDLAETVAAPTALPYYLPLPPLLRAAGRDDLAAALEPLIPSGEAGAPRRGLLSRFLGASE